MLNCRSMLGWLCHWKHAGAFGFSTDKSLTYCEITPATGWLSAPLPLWASSRLRSVSTSPSSAIIGYPAGGGARRGRALFVCNSALSRARLIHGRSVGDGAEPAADERRVRQ